MKKTFLITISYLVETDNDAFDLSTISNDNNLDSGEKLKWIETSKLELNEKIENCGKCSSCNVWTTDMERENPIKELSNGARIEGILFCDECLPANHRWSF